MLDLVDCNLEAPVVGRSPTRSGIPEHQLGTLSEYATNTSTDLLLGHEDLGGTAMGKKRKTARSGDMPLSKSAAIRAYFAAHPTAGSAEAARALQHEGYEVSRSFVAQIRSKSKTVETLQATAESPPSTPAEATNTEEPTPVDCVDASAIMQAAHFIQSVGSIRQARLALQAAERLAAVLGKNSS